MKNLFTLILALLLLALPVAALDEPAHVKVEQQGFYGGALSDAAPDGDLIFLDSVGGNDGNPGKDKLHPVKTLSVAIGKAGAGDTIIVDRGGAETITSAISITQADLAIVCPAPEKNQNFTLTGGNHHLFNVTVDGVRIEGFKFVNSTVTATKAQVLATNADELVVKDCVFNAAASPHSFSIVGVGLQNNCIDPVIANCDFLDPGFGVLITGNVEESCIRPVIKDCKFLVGKDSSFGINATSTQKINGLVVKDCEFIEASSNGTAAHAAWNGTTGADATRGPLKLAASVDQFLVKECFGTTASAYGFATTCYVTSGAVGDIVGCDNGSDH